MNTLHAFLRKVQARHRKEEKAMEIALQRRALENKLEEQEIEAAIGRINCGITSDPVHNNCANCKVFLNNVGASYCGKPACQQARKAKNKRDSRGQKKGK